MKDSESNHLSNASLAPKENNVVKKEKVNLFTIQQKFGILFFSDPTLIGKAVNF